MQVHPIPIRGVGTGGAQGFLQLWTSEIVALMKKCFYLFQFIEISIWNYLDF